VTPVNHRHGPDPAYLGVNPAEMAYAPTPAKTKPDPPTTEQTGAGRRVFVVPIALSWPFCPRPLWVQPFGRDPLPPEPRRRSESGSGVDDQHRHRHGLPTRQ
jgi:hypothetical protein